MIDNLDEVRVIADDKHHLAMLSVYQFYSQGTKFSSNRGMTATELDERPRSAMPKTVAEFSDCFRPDRANTVEEDANLDAYAAVTQAKEIVHQPEQTAIYFGVDFDLSDEAGRKNVVSYFQIVRRIVTAAHYKVGIYGNGSVADLLYSNGKPKERLVDYVWLNASAGHQGSSESC